MRKWIGGCLLIGLAVIGFGLWTGYRKLASFGSANGTETMAIHAPVARVFASLANADSLTSWMGGERLSISAGHHGMLVSGDTLTIRGPGPFSFGAERMKWAVTEVTPNQRLVLQLRSDSTGRMVARREFTLAAAGDSTLVMSVVASPSLDSMRAGRRDSIKASDALIAGASKMMMGSLRMQSHLEMEQLKNRIEGKSANHAGRR